jgi:hypothetical protein
VLCYIHIERAGGTTLQHLFRHNHPLGYVMLTPWFFWSNEPGNVFTAAEARVLLRAVPGVWGFGGHTTRSYLNYEQALGRPVQYLTFLREPLARYISHYQYQRQRMGIDRDFDDFLREPRFDNLMVRRIAGREDLGQAKRALAEDYCFVGLTDRFDESLVLMKQRLELAEFDIAYEIKNAGTGSSCRRDPRWEDETVRERISDKNRLDLELYRFAERELFPRYLAEYSGDFPAALNGLQQQKRSARFSRPRRALWAGYRYFYYRNLEALLHWWYHRRR